MEGARVEPVLVSAEENSSTAHQGGGKSRPSPKEPGVCAPVHLRGAPPPGRASGSATVGCPRRHRLGPLGTHESPPEWLALRHLPAGAADCTESEELAALQVAEHPHDQVGGQVAPRYHGWVEAGAITASAAFSLFPPLPRNTAEQTRRGGGQWRLRLRHRHPHPRQRPQHRGAPSSTVGRGAGRSWSLATYGGPCGGPCGSPPPGLPVGLPPSRPGQMSPTTSSSSRTRKLQTLQVLQMPQMCPRRPRPAMNE